MRGTGKATLATSLIGEGGQRWPYASLVTVATTQDGSPILLLSGLSEHTRNIAADDRVSLLFDGSDGYANPQQGPRVTLLGRAHRTEDAACRVRFLARHPAAQLYAGFGDFGFWRIEMLRAHYVGGFARAVWVEDNLAAATAVAQGMAAAEAAILAHMNQDHGAAVQLYARRLLGQSTDGWRMSGIDLDGCDLMRGESILRLSFDQPLTGPEAARTVLAELAERARTMALAPDDR